MEAAVGDGRRMIGERLAVDLAVGPRRPVRSACELPDVVGREGELEVHLRARREPSSPGELEAVRDPLPRRHVVVLDPLGDVPLHRLGERHARCAAVGVVTYEPDDDGLDELADE